MSNTKNGLEVQVNKNKVHNISNQTMINMKFFYNIKISIHNIKIIIFIYTSCDGIINLSG